jgi:hypothetical protein
MSDREWDELKGNVQKVTTESAKLENKSDKLVEGKRQLHSITLYDKEGNRVKEVIYSSKGDEEVLREYGFIDGNRVVKEQFNYGYGTGGVYPSGKSQAKPPDPRYTNRFEYKYDDKGNRIEEIWYRNNGNLLGRRVSVYDKSGNRTEVVWYMKDGKLLDRTVFTYDESGSLKEESSTRTDTDMTWKWSYSDYEYDSHGNWIKRKKMRWVTKGGSAYFEPYEITYRTISYF